MTPMKWLKRTRLVAQNFFRPARADKDLDDEVRSYADMLSDEKIGEGMKPQEARRAARIEMGGIEQVKEEVRHARTGAALETLWQDLRYGARMLYKKPGFTAVAVVTLALGIGANSAIYSVMNASLLAPVPVPSPDRVVMVWTDNPLRGWHELPASALDYSDWKASGIFKNLAAFHDANFNLRIADKTERVAGLRVTSDWFDIQQVKPYLGRVFNSEDMHPGHDRVAVVGYDLWTSRFAGDPQIAGKGVIVNGEPFTIIGVLPRHALNVDKEVFYAPLLFDTAADLYRGSRSDLVIGRLHDGLSLAAAHHRMLDLSLRMAKQYHADAGSSVRLQPIKEAYVEDIQALVILLLCAVSFVLLVACANIANLLLVRGTARRKEMAVRSALGASRSRLACQLISESVLLAVLGGIAGILPAWAGIRLIANFKLEELPRPELVTLNASVVTFTFILAVITGILFGLAPAWQLWRSDTNQPLKEAQRSNTAGPQRRLRNIFVAAEVAVTVILLAGAGLMLRSFVHLRTADPGYDTGHVLKLEMALSGPQYDTPEKQIAFYRNVLTRLKSLPGVESVAATNLLPEGDNVHASGLFFAGRPDPKFGEAPIVLNGSVTSDYFRTMRIPILRGRRFEETDRAQAPLTAIVDEEAVKRYWPHADPVGKLIRLGSKQPLRMVIGVAGNVEQSLIVRFLKGRLAQVYVPFAQMPKTEVSLVLSSQIEPATLTREARAAVAAIDPDQPPFQIQMLSEARRKGNAPARLATILLGFFAALALLLAAVGIYGVISYTVGQRIREIGIRIALGAGKADLLKVVLGKGGLLILAGAAVGLSGAIALTRLMRGLLTGISPNDPLTFVGVLCAGCRRARGKLRPGAPRQPCRSHRRPALRVSERSHATKKRFTPAPQTAPGIPLLPFFVLPANRNLPGGELHL